MGGDGSDSDLEDDLFDYFSEEDNDTAFVDYLSDGEEEVFEIITQKIAPKPRQKPSKMFDATFLTRIYFALDKEEYVDTDLRPLAEDHDFVGDQFPIYDPSKNGTNGYKVYYDVNTPRKLHAKCSKDAVERKCPFRLWASWMSREKSFQIKTLVDQHACSRTYEYGTLITSDWIARNYAKKIMINPNIKIREIVELILKKYTCKVTLSQARRGKKKALNQYQTCLEDHYGMLWSYASEILNSNPGSTCKLGVDNMPDGKNYFKTFCVCFKGVKQGWLQGCRRVIGLDGCFLKTLCKGELLSAVGRDGNNRIYPIAWAVVSVENKENWSWFIKCLIDDLGIDFGAGLTIISDQHKGLIEAAKEIIPLAEHRQCARHIYANFRKKFNGVVYRNLFWKAAKATYPAKFERIMSEMKSVSMDAHKHLMERKPKSWSRAFFSTDKACDAVENGISECFNALIVEARRKPIINMLEDIRLMTMERMQKMGEKHEKWNDGICPNIRKKFEIIKDLHMLVPSGESKFEVRNGYDGFRVDERMMTCSCRAWQLSGIPCQHGCASIYFLHKDPEDYISDWYGKHMFVSAYSTYIEGMNGMDQWPTTEYTKPLPPVVKKMLGRPPHKRKRDAGEKDDGNRTRSCPTKGDGEGSANGSQGASGSSVRGGGSTRGGGSARGGSTSGSSVRVFSISGHYREPTEYEVGIELVREETNRVRFYLMEMDCMLSTSDEAVIFASSASSNPLILIFYSDSHLLLLRWSLQKADRHRRMEFELVREETDRVPPDYDFFVHSYRMQSGGKKSEYVLYLMERDCHAFSTSGWNWKVVPSRESKFKVRNGYDGFRVDERMMTCSCRAWQLSGIPCQHGCAAIYFLHKDPEDYISDWYGKHMFVSAYSTYIEGMNGMDQWPTTKYTKPLPLVVKKMPGRPPHKRKRDACEKDDGNRTRLGRKGVIMHYFICKKDGHNLRSCPTKGDGEGSASGSQGASGSSVRGGKTTRGGGSARGGRSARGGGSARGGSTSGSSVRGGKTTRGGGSASGSQSDRGGQGSRGGSQGSTSCRRGVRTRGGGSQGSTSCRGGVRTRGGGSQGSAQDSAQGSAHGSASVGGSQGSASGIQGSQVFKRVNGKAVRQRGRGDGSKSSAYPHGIRPIGYGVSWDPIDGETMVGNMQGIPVPAWPYDGSPADLLGADEIPLTGTQPMASQDPIDEPVPNVPAPNQPVPNVPAPNQPALNVPAPIMRRESERIKMIKFSKPVSPGPGLTPEDAMLVE
ncbi:hypothetical protein Tco_1176759 [Tanacetum coccineum]